jgi:hypothetical protein
MGLIAARLRSRRTITRSASATELHGGKSREERGRLYSGNCQAQAPSALLNGDYRTRRTMHKLVRGAVHPIDLVTGAAATDY